MKELIISGKVFAKYEVEGSLLFLKMIIKIYPKNEALSEECLIMIIQEIENIKFEGVGFLNV